MKKTILWSTLFTLIGTQVYAEQAPQAAPTPAASQGTTAPASTPAAAPTTNQAPAAILAPNQPAPATAPSAAQPTPAPASTSTTTTTVTSPTTQPSLPPVPGQVAPAPAAPVINCNYKIPAQTKKVEQNVVLSWAQNAVIQSFSFDSALLDEQMQKLQPCFTEQGWTGFNSALQKSGNIEAIKSQKLQVSSHIDGQTLINEIKENQWKLIVPLAVVYQNDKEKVSQLLSIDLAVSRKPNGDLGITQMIAAPRGSVTTKKAPEAPENPSQTSLDTKPADE